MIPNYSDEYFITLIRATETYNTIWVTDDGNIFATKTQAEMRSKDALKVHKVVRYAEITKGNEPANNEELEKVFTAQYMAQTNKQQPASTIARKSPELSDANKAKEIF